MKTVDMMKYYIAVDGVEVAYVDSLQDAKEWMKAHKGEGQVMELFTLGSNKFIAIQ